MNISTIPSVDSSSGGSSRSRTPCAGETGFPSILSINGLASSAARYGGNHSLRSSTPNLFIEDTHWLERQEQLSAVIPKTQPSNPNAIAQAIQRTQKRLAQLTTITTTKYQQLNDEHTAQQDILSGVNKRFNRKLYQKIQSRIEELQKEIAELKQHSAVITYLRLQNRVKQLEKLSTQNVIDVIGFDGWGQDCITRNIPHNPELKAKPRTNLGEYDAVIYRENGVIKIKRLNATIQLKTTKSLPHNFYLETQKHAQQKTYIDANAKRACLNDGRFWLTTSGWQKQKTWIGKLGASSGGFAFDGPDDCASFAKESVEGIAQPLIHLGVLGAFYPFVALGARGLKDELNEIRDNIDAIIAKQQEINAGIHTNLQSLNINSDQALPKLFSDLVSKTQSNDSLTNEKIWQTCILLMQRATLKDQLQWAKADNKEVWCAKHGMQGMLQAMRLFMLEAGSTLTSLLTSGNTASTSAMAAFVLGNIGSGVMGSGQTLMMIAGAIKTTNGLRRWQQLRHQARQLETLNTGDNHLKNIAKQIAQHKRLQAKWAALTQTLPGSSLTIGQALMASWSGLSLAALGSGVGAPALPVMLSLLVPGVTLTLAAVGLEKTNEHYQENQLAQHEIDDGFDAQQYLHSLFHHQTSLQQTSVQQTSSPHSIDASSVAGLNAWQTTLTDEYEKLSTHLETLAPTKKSRWITLPSLKQMRTVSQAPTIQLEAISEILGTPLSELRSEAPTEDQKITVILEQMCALDCMENFVEKLYQQRRQAVRQHKNIELSNQTADIFDIQQTQKKRRLGGYTIKRYYALNTTQLLEKIKTDQKLKADFYHTAQKTLTTFATLRLRAMQNTVGEVLGTQLLTWA